MKIYFTDEFVLPLPEGHRFPMSKYALLRHRISESSWVEAGQLRVPHAATDAELALAHDPAYIERVEAGSLRRDEVRRIGFPWSPGMVERSRRSAGATIEACITAMNDGVAVSLAGGTHHAFRDRGEGFCVFNDSVVAARVLRQAGTLRRVLVIDCDVHQGNGTAAIAAEDAELFTFSIHGARNYPFRKERSDLDIALEDGTGDQPYLDALDGGLHQALERSRPQLAIYLAGADPFVKDRWGRLALSKSGLAERDRLVFDRVRASGIPVAITMAGGYAPSVDDIVDIHYRTVCAACGLVESTGEPRRTSVDERA